ncbi:helix-turn-helix domain-containing protein [Streptomyces sp. SID5910]|uniref:TetR/AcrR family transcriptional regulator n=1 Tax=Streptomyces sp. SID5910 TaxID=2690312 RepID=UPI0031FA1557
MDAAEAILNEGGVESLTAGAVAARAGIARNSIYRYFGSIEDLLELVVTREFPAWIDVVRAYTGEEALRCAFSYYRALPTSAQQIQDAVVTARLTMPTMAVGSHPVGTGLEHQLRPIADGLVGHHLQDCGHIIPLDRPDVLLALLTPFLSADLPK